MTKKVLITAGAVYGSLDDNKVVSNRVRGIWAYSLALWLQQKSCQVTLLVPKTFPKRDVLEAQQAGVEVILQDGFEDYQRICLDLAGKVDAAIMAAAVVNWIPSEPYSGKMPTKGYKPGDIINIPFTLAPRVIDRMKGVNPRLTLIGCKLLVGASYNDLIETAYADVVLPARCTAVIANDLTNLKAKYLIYGDRSVHLYDNNFPGLYQTIKDLIFDDYFSTNINPPTLENFPEKDIFDAVVDKYRDRFISRTAKSDKTFGSIFVPSKADGTVGWASPRHKARNFTSQDAVPIESLDPDGHHLTIKSTHKATLNAPLMVRMAQKYPQATAILHLHETLPDVPTEAYAPPGSVRDSCRAIPAPAFNIDGHGFIACLDKNLEIIKKEV